MSRQTQYTINLPLKITHNKKGDYLLLGLNQYRNAHFQILNKVKVLFEEQVTPDIIVLPKIKKLNITYILFLGSNHKADLSNMCVIIDKFFCDSLTNNKIIEDDNITVINDIHYKWGGVDKLNPRVEAILNIIEFQEEEPMRVTLVESEINEALTNWVHERMPTIAGQNVQIDLKAGRGEDGFTAELNFTLNQNVTTTASTDTAQTVATTSFTGLNNPPFDIDRPNKARVGNTEQQQAAVRTNEIAKQVGDTPLLTPAKPEPSPDVFANLGKTPVAIENNALEQARELAATNLNKATENLSVKAAVEATQAPTSVSQPKSLFGNLTPPVHDPK